MCINFYFQKEGTAQHCECLCIQMLSMPRWFHSNKLKHKTMFYTPCVFSCRNRPPATHQCDTVSSYYQPVKVNAPLENSPWSMEVDRKKSMTKDWVFLDITRFIFSPLCKWNDKNLCWFKYCLVISQNVTDYKISITKTLDWNSSIRIKWARSWVNKDENSCWQGTPDWIMGLTEYLQVWFLRLLFLNVFI